MAATTVDGGQSSILTIKPWTAPMKWNGCGGRDLRVRIVSDTCWPHGWIGKNNLMLALKELEEEQGLVFNLDWGRLPFFLRPGEETVSNWLSGLGFDRDAPRGEVMKKAFGGPKVLEQLDKLNVQAGLSPSYWNAQFADTMDSHRLAMYAAAVSPVKGEAFWKATSRRYFEGKDTQISPIRLDSHEMLMECAAEAGLDLQKARKVLESDMYRNEVWQTVRQMHQAGIQSIPVLIFEVDGVSKNPMVHHGSGHKEDFRSILLQLHAEAATAKL